MTPREMKHHGYKLLAEADKGRYGTPGSSIEECSVAIWERRGRFIAVAVARRGSNQGVYEWHHKEERVGTGASAGEAVRDAVALIEDATEEDVSDGSKARVAAAGSEALAELEMDATDCPPFAPFELGAETMADYKRRFSAHVKEVAAWVASQGGKV